MIDKGTDQLIAHVTGRRPVFVREHQQGNPLPQNAAEFADLARQLDFGHSPVVSGIDAPYGKFPAEGLVQRVVQDTAANVSDILSFDLDAGNSEQVLAALPDVLIRLQDQGFVFRPLRDAGQLSPDAAMPFAIDPGPLRDYIIFGLFGFFQTGLTQVFLWLMVFAAVRSMIYLGLALWRGGRSGFDPAYQPPVTVIIPAYHEEKVIEKCIESIMRTTYDNYVIVVVDDGSTDQTSHVVTKIFGHNPRVRLLRQKNRGKWYAANHGLSVVDTPFFVIADADSLFLPDTIPWLVQQFKDERVGAVAGLVEVGNHENILTDWDRLEYIVSQSVMRRAYETFEAILVVSGAVGAWRTDAVLKARQFSGETITEDADLTVAVHRAGYLVRFQEQARSITEGPATVRPLMRQRLRWTFGMLEVSWKHRGAITEGRTVGYIAIIDAIWFGLIS